MVRGALDEFPHRRDGLGSEHRRHSVSVLARNLLEAEINSNPEAWVFPSEKIETPIRKENLWFRSMRPRLRAVGLGWVNFQVMRRTHASLMNKLEVDPKIVAERLGHTLDVNLNVYTKAGHNRRKQAALRLIPVSC